MIRSRILAGVGVGMLALTLAACGSETSTGGGGGSSPSSDNSAAVTIKVLPDPTTTGKFDPASATAKVGDTVKWDFQDDQNPHTVTADDGTFDSGSTPKNKGETFTFTFTKAGTYKYHCTLHSAMTATITVS